MVPPTHRLDVCDGKNTFSSCRGLFLIVLRRESHTWPAIIQCTSTETSGGHSGKFQEHLEEVQRKFVVDPGIEIKALVHGIIDSSWQNELCATPLVWPAVGCTEVGSAGCAIAETPAERMIFS